MKQIMKKKIPLDEARSIADEVIEILEPHCKRIEIAGSIRRQCETVGDIEIVIEPIKLMRDLFGNLDGESNLNYIDFTKLLIANKIKAGSRMKQFYLIEHDIILDLFIVLPPAQWGVIFTIRTGSENFSHQLVKIKKYGGLLPSNMQIANGCLRWRETKDVINTPEEIDLFNAIGLTWIDPKDRL